MRSSNQKRSITIQTSKVERLKHIFFIKISDDTDLCLYIGALLSIEGACSDNCTGLASTEEYTAELQIRCVKFITVSGQKIRSKIDSFELGHST